MYILNEYNLNIFHIKLFMCYWKSLERLVFKGYGESNLGSWCVAEIN